MKLAHRSGTTIAAAVATLLLAGAVVAPIAQAEEAMGQCIGGNSCKGQGACKSASNSCKGQNACKGKGFVSLTKSECAKIPGTKFEMPKM